MIMTTHLCISVSFHLKSVLGGYFVKVGLLVGKMNTSSVQQRPYLKQIMQHCQVIHILSNRIDPGSKHYS
jgi:hypothetical protein